MNKPICAIEWRNNRLILLDQRVLPAQECYLEFGNSGAVAAAIRDMVVRGAPAIGIAAAYAVVLAAMQRWQDSPADWKTHIQADIKELRDSRPTAVNLHWALERLQKVMDDLSSNPVEALLNAARQIHEDDLQANKTMGWSGAELLPASSTVLTHCNTGSLATGGFGTALGVIRAAHQLGKIEKVYAGETRPWLQGSRLTAWELQKEQIPVTLLCDSAVASLFYRGEISWVIVGADRIAANGDVANKIGTYSLAVLARHHGVKFMVVAPISTFDATIASGDDIPVEHRHGEELLKVGPHHVGTAGVDAWNPVFDITPAGLIDAIITERGQVLKPDQDKIARLLSGIT